MGMIRGMLFAATVITVAINKMTVMDGEVLRSMRAISARPGGRLGGGATTLSQFNADQAKRKATEEEKA